jgi:hypothetical protein
MQKRPSHLKNQLKHTYVNPSQALELTVSTMEFIIRETCLFIFRRICTTQNPGSSPHVTEIWMIEDGRAERRYEGMKLSNAQISQSLNKLKGVRR